MYERPTNKIICNEDQMLNPLKLRLRQECPLLKLLFNIVLANSIMQEKGIKCINTGK